MLIALISILFLTGGVWLLGKISPIKICPICAGVSGTWLWMLIGTLSGQFAISNFQLPMAILMGGSIVGIAYQFERHLLKNEKYHLIWKGLFIPFGFVTVYWAVNLSGWAILGAGVLIILALIFGRRPELSRRISKTAAELEKKMEKCC